MAVKAFGLRDPVCARVTIGWVEFSEDRKWARFGGGGIVDGTVDVEETGGVGDLRDEEELKKEVLEALGLVKEEDKEG